MSKHEDFSIAFADSLLANWPTYPADGYGMPVADIVKLAVDAAVRVWNATSDAEVVNLINVLESHDIESLDCDRRGDKYCSCLPNAIERVKALLSEAKTP